MRAIVYLFSLVLLSAVSALAQAQSASSATKPAQVTHRDVGVVVGAIDTVKMAFTLQLEVVQDGKKTTVTQNYVYHKVKEKFFKDLKPGDKVEVTWYNKAGDLPIAAASKVLALAAPSKPPTSAVPPASAVPPTSAVPPKPKS
jgi:hypothetical protein